jgi:hypothetical protein
MAVGRPQGIAQRRGDTVDRFDRISLTDTLRLKITIYINPLVIHGGRYGVAGLGRSHDPFTRLSHRQTAAAGKKLLRRCESAGTTRNYRLRKT